MFCPEFLASFLPFAARKAYLPFAFLVAVSLPAGALDAEASASAATVAPGQPEQTSQAAPTVLREQASLDLLEHSLAVLGGARGWDQLRSIRVQGKQTHDGKEQPFTWADTWGDDHQARTSVRNVEDGGATKPERQQQTNTSAAVPQFSAFSKLIAHAPGAAIRLVLKDKSYQVTPSVALTPGGIDCVQILLPGKRLWDGGLFANLCLSKETSLPTKVDLALPTSSPGRQMFFETIRFDSFQVQNGITRPSEITFLRPGGNETHVSLQQVQFGEGNQDLTKGMAK